MHFILRKDTGKLNHEDNHNVHLYRFSTVMQKFDSFIMNQLRNEYFSYIKSASLIA